MNGKTATVLARAASALAVIHVGNDPRAENLSPQGRGRAVRLSARRIYEGLKCKWTGSDHRARGKLRRSLKNVTMRTRHVLRKGLAA